MRKINFVLHIQQRKEMDVSGPTALFHLLKEIFIFFRFKQKKKSERKGEKTAKKKIPYASIPISFFFLKVAKPVKKFTTVLVIVNVQSYKKSKTLC